MRHWLQVGPGMAGEVPSQHIIRLPEEAREGGAGLTLGDEPGSSPGVIPCGFFVSNNFIEIVHIPYKSPIGSVQLRGF